MRRLIVALAPIYLSISLVACYEGKILNGDDEEPTTTNVVALEEDKNMIENDTEGLDKEEKDENLSDLKPMVMINDKIYIDTGKESNIEGRCGTFDGEITSLVSQNEKPKENNQCNFKSGVGVGYQYVTDTSIELFLNEKWFVFQIDDDLGVTLSADNITENGLTLNCVQNDEIGQPTGELQSSSYFWIEKDVEGMWEKLEFPQNIAFDDMALIVNRNDVTTWDIDWSYIWTLDNGKYRLHKELMDFRGTGDYDIYDYFIEFQL